MTIRPDLFMWFLTYAGRADAYLKLHLMSIDLFMWFLTYAGRADVVVDNDKGEMR